MNFCILHERAYWVGVYTPKQSRIRHCMFVLTDYIHIHFLLTLILLDIINIFSIHVKLEFRYFTWESLLSIVYTAKQSRKGRCIFFLTDYIQILFFLTLGCLDNSIYLNSRKIRISVFYMRKHIELLYILQNKVENDILYFFWQIIFRAILFLTLACRDNI